MDNRAQGYGHVNEFNPEKYSWENYIMQVEFYFEANGISDDKQKEAILLSAGGNELFTTCKNVAQPKDLTGVTYKEVITLLSNHYTPKPNKIVERFKFNQRNQKQGENISEYIAGLRRLSQFCEFNDLDDMLRDRIVCGMRNESLQKRLLSDKNLTLGKVIEETQAAEMAEQNMQELKSTAEMNYVKMGTGYKKKENHKSQKRQGEREEGYKLCYRCKGDHASRTCKFKSAECYHCKKTGHIVKACRIKENDERERDDKEKPGKAHCIREIKDEGFIYKINEVSCPPLLITIKIKGREVQMELDTGSGHSLMSVHTFKSLFPEVRKIPKSALKLRTWGSPDILPLAGCIEMWARYRDKSVKLPLVIVEGQGPTLIGRQWIGALGITQFSVNQIHAAPKQEFPEKWKRAFSEIFQEGLGTYRGELIKIKTLRNTTPKFLKARPVPLAMKPKIERELDRLVQDKVLIPVSQSEWATPIVPVVKPDGSVRICGDYKCTVNRVIQNVVYPLPTNTEVLAVLAGGTMFTKLDLDRAYTQVEVDSESAKKLTLITHKGLFNVTRLPFGVSTAPMIFQKIMESAVRGIPGVAVYIDDVIITGQTEEEHDVRVK